MLCPLKFNSDMKILNMKSLKGNECEKEKCEWYIGHTEIGTSVTNEEFGIGKAGCAIKLIAEKA